jgi:hypothetical protein
MTKDRAMTAKLHLVDGEVRTFGIIAPEGAAPLSLDGRAVSMGEFGGMFRLRPTNDPTGQNFDYDAAPR